MQAGPQALTLLASLHHHPPCHLVLMLYNPPKESNFNPQYIFKASKIWKDPAVGWS